MRDLRAAVVLGAAIFAAMVALDVVYLVATGQAFAQFWRTPVLAGGIVALAYIWRTCRVKENPDGR